MDHFVTPLRIVEEDPVATGDASHLAEVSNEISKKRFLLVII